VKIDIESINWLAVLVATLATFILGGLWYGALFKKLWQRLHGYSDDQIKQMQKARPPAFFFGVMLASYFVMSVVLSIILAAAGITTAAGGITLAVLVWFGIAAAIAMTDWVSSDRRLASFGLDLAYQFCFLVMMGAILGGWR
jgi:hypothetical protein